MLENRTRLLKFVYNNPNLPRIDYRIGNYSTFRYDMLESIKKDSFLEKWTDYSSFNYGTIMIEMWAYLLDILTFYQEIIANESFLRTAQFKESLIGQCNIIDYELSPGVSATTFVMFTAEKDKSGIIPKFFKLQTKSLSDKSPQVFETDEEHFISSEFNEINLFIPKNDYPISERVILSGDHRYLLVGNYVLLEKNENDGGSSASSTVIKKITGVNYDPEKLQTELKWVSFVSNENTDNETHTSTNTTLRFMKTKTNVFGYNAPPDEILEKIHTSLNSPDKLDDDDHLRLDNVYDTLKTNDTVIIIDTDKIGGDKQSFFRYTIKQVIESTAVNYGLSSKITILVLDGDLPSLRIRSTLVLGEPVDLTSHIVNYIDNESQINILSTDNKIELDGLFESLREDSHVCIKSILNNTSIIKQITAIDVDNNLAITTIFFNSELGESIDKRNVVVNANIVAASHGETVKDEILGSGDKAHLYQHFKLKNKPVTFIPSTIGSRGSLNSLQVFVNNTKWIEVKNLLNSGSADRHYYTFMNENDEMTVQFGNGLKGSLLPTGVDNVRARYRKGIGTLGNTDPNTITNVMGISSAIKAVTNPIPSSGGTDPEDLENVKTMAPLSLKTFDRAVSLEDYQNIAILYSGIAKAKAFLAKPESGLANGTVIIIIAPSGGGGEASNRLKADFRSFIDERRDTTIPLRIKSYIPVKLYIKLYVRVKSSHLQSTVKLSVILALSDSQNKDGTYNFFAFNRLQFGQTIYLSDIYNIVAKVDGVEFLVVRGFGKSISELQEFVILEEDQIAEIHEKDLVIEMDGGITK